MAPEKKRRRPSEGISTPQSKQKPKETPSKRPKTTVTEAERPPPPPPSALKNIREEETSFPRGGAAALTPLEYKEVANEAAEDALFEARGAATGAGDAAMKAKKKVRRREEGKWGEAERKTDDTASRKKDLGPRIEGLSYKRLVPGTLVLGCVEKINQTDIAISLPNNLTGYVPITQISEKISSRVETLLEELESASDSDSDPSPTPDEESKGGVRAGAEDLELSKVFRVGQYVRAHVLHAIEDIPVKAERPGTALPKTKKRIELSLYPKLTNKHLSKSDLVVGCTVQAAVKSVEDHGLVMDIGLESDVRGFLSSRELGARLSLSDVQEGQILLCTVTGSSSNGKIIKLSADLEQKFSKKGKLAGGKGAWWLDSAPTVDAFLPGTGAEVQVTDIGKQGGIVGKIMGMLDAVADLFHVAGWEEGLEQKIKVGSRIKARITGTFPDCDPKKISFSILPHILSFVPPSEQDPLSALPISTILDAVKVIGVGPKVGLFVDVGVEGIPGFVHISRVTSDGKILELPPNSGPYEIGTVHSARILGFNSMDGLYILSMEKRVLEQPFLRLEDIKVGEVVKGRVEKVLERGGVVVQVSDGISGIVEEEHVSDIKLKNPEKKFRVGADVRARVLTINHVRKKLCLTLKKTLVNTDVPIITSYNIEPGMQSVGTLGNIMQSGAVVKFFASVTAFLPVSEMSEAFIHDPREHFRVGQSVNIHVLSVDPENKRMQVSCKDPSRFGEAQKRAFDALRPGQVISGKVSEKSDHDLVLDLEDVGASGLKGVLTVSHLTDGSKEKNASTMRKLRAGQTLSNLLVLDKNESRHMIYLTMKPSLIEASREGSLIDDFEKIGEHAIVQGFVKNTTDDHIFVGFIGGVTGLVMRKGIPDEAQSLPSFGYSMNQSVTARVLHVDPTQRRFLLSLKPTDYAEEEQKPAKDVSPNAAVNPIDRKSKTVDDYRPGKLTRAKIVSVQQTQINVQLADNVQGRIDVSQIFDSWDQIADRKNPLAKYKKGEVIDAKIIGIHDARNHRFLAITHRTSNKKSPIFELSAKPKDLGPDSTDILTLDKVIVGSSWLAFINNIMPDCVWVNLSPDIRGRINVLDLSDDVAQLRDLEKHFSIGSALKCHVVGVDLDHGKLDLSARGASVHKTDFDSLSKGMVVLGRVTKAMNQRLLVQVSNSVAGVVSLTDVDDDFSKVDPKNFEKNNIVRVCVLDVDKSNKHVALSMRPSRVMSSNLPVKDPEVENIRDVKVRELRRGFVKNASDKGLFVTLAPNITARVRVSDLSDKFLKDWKNQFQVGQIVEGRVIAVDYLLGQIQMSLRQSAITGKPVGGQAALSDFKEGQFIKGKIKKVTDYGVFVAIDKSTVSGLCHKSQIADRKVDDINKLYAEGDPVKAKILKIDLEKRRISFGLKASYFEGGGDTGLEDDARPDNDDDTSESNEDEDGGVKFDMSNVPNISDSGSDAEEPNGGTKKSNTPSALPSDGLSAPFDWTSDNLFTKRTYSDDEDGEALEVVAKKRRKKRRVEIQQDLTEKLNSTEAGSTSDYERLILGDPSNSGLWIQYMAFHLQLGEVEQARAIAERALKTISQRELDEKRNVWIAMLNMENSYGSDESLEETFKRAIQYNDAQDIHERMISIFIQSGKSQKADTLFKAMVKKFSQHSEVWFNYATFLLTNLHDRPAVRELLKRALQALPQEVHRNLIIKFASLEFKTSDPERGRTLFENLLGAYAKRMDIWNVFIDMEIGHGGNTKEKQQVDAVRSLFRRALADEKCRPRTASELFRKWKKWEEEIVKDENGVKEVMEKARRYVEDTKRKEEEEG